MVNKIKIITWIVILLASVSSCNRDDPAKSFVEKVKVAKGENIYELKESLLEKGYKVSDVVDQTGKGEKLTMSIRLNEASELDKLGYSSGVDLEPWKKGEKSHLIVKATINGVITEIQAR